MTRAKTRTHARNQTRRLYAALTPDERRQLVEHQLFAARQLPGHEGRVSCADKTCRQFAHDACDHCRYNTNTTSAGEH